MSLPALATTTALAATLLLAVACIAAACLRRQPVWENALWRTVLVLLLLLPAALTLGAQMMPLHPSATLPMQWISGLEQDQDAITLPMGAERQPVRVASADHKALWPGLLLLWGVGAAVSLVGLGRSLGQVRRLTRTSHPLPSGQNRATLARCAKTAGVRVPELRVATGLSTPVLVGWVRPCILVPAPACASQSEVLLHELAHLRRRDLWWFTLARVLCAGWWFHPLAWKLAQRLERSAEEVCDDLVLLWTSDAAAYADRLMDYARHASEGRHPSLMGAAIMGLRSELGKRLARVLEPNRALRVTIHRLGAISLAVGGGLLLTLVAAVSPSRGQGTGPTPAPPATPPQKAVANAGSGGAAAAMQRKLATILFPNVEFRGATLNDVADYLRKESVKRDQDPDLAKRGINLLLKMSPDEADKIHFALALSNVPLGEVLRYMAEQADLQVAVEPNAVVLSPKAKTGELARFAPAQVNAGGGTTVIKESSAAEKQAQIDVMNRKLSGIVVPLVDFNRTRLTDALEFLRQEAARLDVASNPDQRGLNIFLKLPAKAAFANSGAGAAGESVQRVTVALQQKPILEVLGAVAKQVGMKVVVAPYAVSLVPDPAATQ